MVEASVADKILMYCQTCLAITAMMLNRLCLEQR